MSHEEPKTKEKKTPKPRETGRKLPKEGKLFLAAGLSGAPMPHQKGNFHIIAMDLEGELSAPAEREPHR